MTVAEGGGKRAITRKFQDVYVPALKANYIIWPAVQMLNFRVLPIQFQIVSYQVLTGSRLPYTNTFSSLLSPLSVSLGPFTFHSPTLPKRLRIPALLLP